MRTWSPAAANPAVVGITTVLAIMVAMFTVWFGFVYSILWVITMGLVGSIIDKILAVQTDRPTAPRQAMAMVTCSPAWCPREGCNMSRRRLVWLLTALTVLAFGLRFAAIVYLARVEDVRARWNIDNSRMNLVAGLRLFASRLVFFGPSSVQGPIYPLILAGPFQVARAGDGRRLRDGDGASMRAVGAACVPLLYQMIRKLGDVAAGRPHRRDRSSRSGRRKSTPRRMHSRSCFVSAAVIGLVTLFYRAMREQSTLAWSDVFDPRDAGDPARAGAALADAR